MTTIWILGGLTGVLVALYMARPRLERRQLSAARFFVNLPPARQTNRQLRLSNPLLARPFYLQLLVLLLLLAALLSIFHPLAGAGHAQSIGLWLLIDSSASMSTAQAGSNRMVLAQQAANAVLAQAQIAATEATPPVDLCINISTFDLARRDRQLPDLSGAAAVEAAQAALATITPRALGSDLALIRTLLAQQIVTPSVAISITATGQPLAVQGAVDPTAAACAVTHLVVITDLPAPDWIGEPAPVDMIWRDVSEPVDNSGFNTIRAMRDPLSGLVHGVEVTAQYYNRPPINAQMIITGPTGTRIADEPIQWRGDGTWRTTWLPPGPGQYQLQLIPGGAYTLDDHAILEINEGAAIHVNWQLPETALHEQLGWIQDAQSPQLRVVASNAPGNAAFASTTPTLVVGNGYTGDRSQEILDFYDAGTLLADLNLDVAEQLAIQGTVLPADFIPVLRGADGLVWLAQRRNPPAVLVPGLPTQIEETVDAFSKTAFFNGVRWLLQERPLPPLYTLTTPALPEPAGSRIALHAGEGDTARLPSSYGEISALQPRRVGQRTWPLWPYLLALAMSIFAVERTLALYGGRRWR